MKITDAKKIYLIGIKGAAMAYTAQILKARGFDVSGSDTEETFFTDAVLRKAGIPYLEGYHTQNIPPDADLIIYSGAHSSANPTNNPEISEAIALGLPMMAQVEVLAELFNDKYGIAVCGTHGKSTTTALLGYVLERANLRPTVAVGSSVPQFDGGSALVGSSDLFVVEADEYNHKLRKLKANVTVLNNIEYDHPDVYPSMEEYRAEFKDFIHRTASSGFIVANFHDEEVMAACTEARARVIDYGFTDLNHYHISDVRIEAGKQTFRLFCGGELFGSFSLQLFGRHNVMNATAVIAVAHELQVPLPVIQEALESFTGLARRMERLGEHRGAAFFDDYAHHPTEIAATLAAARERYPDKRITAVFMPHTYSRTKALFKEFATSFEVADHIMLLPIYGSAREQQGGVSSEELAAAIGSKAMFVPDMAAAADRLRGAVSADDVVLLMGAGDTFRVWDKVRV